MKTSAKLIIISFISLFILTTFIYYPSLSGGFYHDDRPNLVFNKDVQINTLSVKSIKEAATSSSAGTLLRPVSMASFALNYYFFGDDPFSFKVTNLILHLLTGLLVFFVTLKITSVTSNERMSSYTLAWVVTAIWLVHPLNVSTVAYAVQRMAILSSLFSLLAIYLYLNGRIKISSNTPLGIILFLLSAISIILGIYSKENAALTPALIVLIEIIVFYPLIRSKQHKKYINYFALFIGITSLGIIFIFYNHFHSFVSNWYFETREFTLAERLYTQSRVMILYMKWIIFPNIQELGLFHDDIPISNSIISPITTLFSIIVLTFLISIAIKIRKKYALISLGVFWFFIGHTLESTIIPLEMIYEHRNYLPSIGLILSIVYIIIETITKLNRLKLYKFHVFFTVIALFSIVTFIRASQWSDPINFAYFEVSHHPDSLRANHLLGLEYRGMVDKGYKEYRTKAYKYLENASRIGRKRLFSEYALIQLADSLNEPAKPIWIDRMAIKLSKPVLRIEDILILEKLSLCHENKCLLPRDASQILFNAVKSNQRLELTPRIEAKYYSVRANFILQRGGDLDHAIYYLQKSISVNPYYIQNYIDLINSLLLLDRPHDALAYLKKAKEINRNPENIELLERINVSVIKTINTYNQKHLNYENPSY